MGPSFFHSKPECTPLSRTELQERVSELFAARMTPLASRQRKKLKQFRERIVAGLETNMALGEQARPAWFIRPGSALRGLTGIEKAQSARRG